MANPIVHWEIAGPDHEGLRTFYEELFGWKSEAVDENYALVQPEEGPGGGIMRTSGGMPPYITVYVQVDDLKRALERVRELGGEPRVPPTKIGDSMEFALFADPAGNMVGLLAGTRT
ncbi:VOC family protein [Actinomadura sp. ATCC 31491]|uniref:VOC family protein n=1 Tax=Actinomadura luzonensis TaxID=2805427 RepID=A0ABT0FJD2_9ACTN|nr:VOC family protein [Actinomadura luzonensis]MCK2212434.1 VOC family protein [Actinomadura luzonensis]